MEKGMVVVIAGLTGKIIGTVTGVYADLVKIHTSTGTFLVRPADVEHYGWSAA